VPIIVADASGAFCHLVHRGANKRTRWNRYATPSLTRSRRGILVRKCRPVAIMAAIATHFPAHRRGWAAKQLGDRPGRSMRRNLWKSPRVPQASMPTGSDAAPQDESHHAEPPENRSTMTAAGSACRRNTGERDERLIRAAERGFLRSFQPLIPAARRRAEESCRRAYRAGKYAPTNAALLQRVRAAKCLTHVGFEACRHRGDAVGIGRISPGCTGTVAIACPFPDEGPFDVSQTQRIIAPTTVLHDRILPRRADREAPRLMPVGARLLRNLRCRF
jgi:hypothetical protein